MQNDIQLTAGRTIIVYGDSATYKTTESTRFAKWLYKKTRKPVRLISAEISSKAIYDPLIEAGIVEATFMTKAKNPDVALRNLSAGQWPDGDKWLPYIPGSVSGYVIEGLTSLSEQLIEYCRDNKRFNQGSTDEGYTSGGHQFNPAGRNSYGFVQLEVLRAVKAFAALEGIERVLWTSHEVKATDDDSQMLRGPGLAGKAKTDAVQKFCNVLLHFDGVAVGKTGKLERRIWFDRHLDATFPSIYYPAKYTLPVSQVSKWKEKFPGDFIVPTLDSGIDVLLDYEEQLQREAVNELVEWKKSIDNTTNGGN